MKISYCNKMFVIIVFFLFYSCGNNYNISTDELINKCEDDQVEELIIYEDEIISKGNNKTYKTNNLSRNEINTTIDELMIINDSKEDRIEISYVHVSYTKYYGLTIKEIIPLTGIIFIILLI